MIVGNPISTSAIENCSFEALSAVEVLGLQLKIYYFEKEKRSHWMNSEFLYYFQT